MAQIVLMLVKCDVITVTNQITSRNTQLIGGEGNDTFTVQYFRGDNNNAVSGERVRIP